MTTNDSANSVMLGDSLVNINKNTTNRKRKIQSSGGESRGSVQSKRGDIVSPSGKSRQNLAPTVGQIDPVDH